MIVERSLSAPVRFEELQALENRSAACFELLGVRFVRSYLAGDGLRMICVYEARDAESVREANRNAKLPFDRVWSAELHEPGGAP